MGNWKSLLKLKPFLKRYRWILSAGIAGVILSSLLTTPIPFLTGQLVDRVLLGDKNVHDSVLELASILARNENTVKSQLKRSREMLKGVLELE